MLQAADITTSRALETLTLAGRGVPVFPCGDNKGPLTPHPARRPRTAVLPQRLHDRRSTRATCWRTHLRQLRAASRVAQQINRAMDRARGDALRRADDAHRRAQGSHIRRGGAAHRTELALNLNSNINLNMKVTIP
jgi:hypothetical protein